MAGINNILANQRHKLIANVLMGVGLGSGIGFIASDPDNRFEGVFAGAIAGAALGAGALFGKALWGEYGDRLVGYGKRAAVAARTGYDAARASFNAGL